MKIVSYNINGLNAFTNSGRCMSLFDDYPADVYCFQEVKMNTDEDIINKLKEGNRGINVLYANSINTEKKGYAGVLTFFKNKAKIPMINESVNIEKKVFESSDKDKQKYMGGRVITCEYPDFYLINVYVPNSGKKELLRQEWDKQFREYVKTLNKPVIICGDFNVCATELDYWGNYKKAINSAPGLMDFEIEGFNKLCEECNLIDVFRKVNPDTRLYSWYSTRNKKAVENNQGWRIDYFLISDVLKNRIKSVTIADRYQTPDHQPIILEIE